MDGGYPSRESVCDRRENAGPGPSTAHGSSLQAARAYGTCSQGPPPCEEAGAPFSERFPACDSTACAQTGAMSVMTSTAFHVVTVVWGRPYVDLFLDVAVPNQLTPGNLGALPAGSRYRVFAPPEDVERLAATSILDRVNEIIPVDVVAMPELSGVSNGLGPLIAGHRRALQDAAESCAAVVFLNADHFMSEGALAAVVQRHAEGSRAVVSTGIRLNKETFVADLQMRGGIRSIPCRELVSLALDHLHPFTLAHTVDAARTACWPISVYWRIATEGILARPIYLHPLMVHPVERAVLPRRQTIDGNYLRAACPAREQVHVVTDSDELCLFELSSADNMLTGTYPGAMSLWRAAKMLSRCDAYQQSYWRTAVRIHARDLGTAWHPVEEDATRFAAHAMWLQPAARSIYVMSRRLRPLRRHAGALRKQLRRVAKDLAPARVKRSLVRAARPIQTCPEHTLRSSRQMMRRASRSIRLLAHSAARPVHRLRKRAVRAGRRMLRRASPAQ